MTQSKFSLADVITFSVALLYGFICFLGINFFTLGDIGQSALYGLVITLVLGLTAYLTKFFKLSKKNFQASFIAEMFFLLAFTILMFVSSYFIFPHFFVVTSQKTEIRTKLEVSISQADKMFGEYENYAANRKSRFESKLKGIAVLCKSQPEVCKQRFPPPIDPNLQIQNKLQKLEFELFPTNYTDIKQGAQSWYAKANRANDKWKPIGIVNVVNEVEKNTIAWANELNRISKKIEPDEESPPEFGFTPTTPDVKKYFKTLGSPTPLSIGLALIAYFLMLFSWMKSYRDSRGTGAFQTKDYEVVL